MEPVHDPARPASRHLRVVPAVRPRRGHLAARLFGLVTVVSLLAVVVFHAVIAQRQLELDTIGDQTTVEQRRYELNRAGHAQAAAPDRIVQAALAAGMIEPDELTTVAVSFPTGTAPDDGTSRALSDRWSTLKPHLTGQP